MTILENDFSLIYLFLFSYLSEYRMLFYEEHVQISLRTQSFNFSYCLLFKFPLDRCLTVRCSPLYRRSESHCRAVASTEWAVRTLVSSRSFCLSTTSLPLTGPFSIHIFSLFLL